MFVQNLKEFVSEILKLRNYDQENTLLKLGLDGGQGFFKMTLNIINLEAEQGSVSLSQPKKICNLDTGVKKLFIIGIVPEMPEYFVNVKACIRQLSMGDVHLPIVFATDLKLANLMCGLQSCSGLHPCCYCETEAGIWNPAPLRTLGNIRKHYLEWRQSGAKPSDCKHFKNCIHHPLLIGNDRKRIIDIIPPPELHLLMGPFNHMYKHLKNVWPQCEEWANQIHVKQVGYHGGGFIGG